MRRWSIVTRVLTTNPERSIQAQVGADVMFGIQIPVHADGGAGDQGRAPLLTGAMDGIENGPETHAREWPEGPWAEVLLSDDRHGEITKSPGAHGEIHALVSPTVLHDEADEADSTKTDPQP